MRLDKKGIILTYFLVLLNIVSTFLLNYTAKIYKNDKYETLIKEFRDFAFVEVLVIKHVEEAYIEFEEEDETIVFDDFVIEIDYDNLTAYITIENQESELCRKRTLIFDDLEEMIEEYR